MQLFIIRHGQSEADLLGVHEGCADFSLTELGEEQARKMATYIAQDFAPDIIVTSPLKRAHRTAEILQEKVGCNLVVEEALMEYNNDVWTAMPCGAGDEKSSQSKDGPPLHGVNGGESELDFRNRIQKVLSKIIHEYKERKRVAIVAHDDTISHLLKVCFGLPTQSNIIFGTGDTGIHRVDIHGNEKVVYFMNRLEHLD